MGLHYGRGSLEQSGDSVVLKAGATDQVTLVAGANVAAATFTFPAATDTLVGRATTDALTNKTFDAEGTGNSLTNISNSNIKAGAAIALSKLAAVSAAQVLLGDGSGVVTGTTLSGDITVNSSGVTAIGAGVIVNADINASAAIAYSKLNLVGSIVNADVNASAAIAYSKLNLSGSIVNADVNASAAIAYSKLALTGSIVNADISGSAAVALSKLAAVTAGTVLVV